MWTPIPSDPWPSTPPHPTPCHRFLYRKRSTRTKGAYLHPRIFRWQRDWWVVRKIEDVIDSIVFATPFSVLSFTQRGNLNHDFYKLHYFSIFSFPILILPWPITGKPKSHSINKDNARISVPSTELFFFKIPVYLNTIGQWGWVKIRRL